MEQRDIQKKYSLVSVEWADAQSDCEWETIDKVRTWAEKDCIIFEIGWLVYENDKYVVISNQIGEDGDLGNRTKIPVQWIRKRKNLGGKK